MLPTSETSRQAFDMLSIISSGPNNTNSDFKTSQGNYVNQIYPERNGTEFTTSKCSRGSMEGIYPGFTNVRTANGHFEQLRGQKCSPKTTDFGYKRLHLDSFTMNTAFPMTSVFAGIMQRRKRRENRIRRQRTTFTSEQTLKLEVEYNRSEYISRPRRYELAEILNLSESQIKIWFQNRRAKEKRIEKAHVDHQLRNCESAHANIAPGFSIPSSYTMLYGSCLWPYPPSAVNDLYQEKPKET